MDPNRIASVILENSTEMSADEHWRRTIKTKLRRMKENMTPISKFDDPFSTEELETAIGSIKLGKAAGLDGLYTEFINHLGKESKNLGFKVFQQNPETCTSSIINDEINHYCHSQAWKISRRSN